MNPTIDFNAHTTTQEIEDDMLLHFTLNGVNVSLANGLRRTIISDIPIIVFKTTPNNLNKCVITTNTTRLNNEIIKQRLSCIPIHIKEINDFPLDKYIMEVNVQNNTDTIIYVTTENFTIRDITTLEPISDEKLREIFPADPYTNYFIDFVRLRPKMADELSGEKLHLTCEFNIGSAKEDGMFNVISTCSYGNTIDIRNQEIELEKKIQIWKDEDKNQAEIQFEIDNWKLLDGKRIFLQNSFDFVIKSIGIYDNHEIVYQGCLILIQKFTEINTIIDNNELEIINSRTTLLNSFDIILQNEDYTIGKILEYLLYSKYYETKVLNFCGFKKIHPHDTFSIIKISYTEPVELSTIKGHLKECITDAIEVYLKIQKSFTS